MTENQIIRLEPINDDELAELGLEKDNNQEFNTDNSAFGNAVIFAAKVLSWFLTTLLWIVVIGPIWVFILVREISTTSIMQMVGTFNSSKSGASLGKLNYIAGLWPNGFGMIIKSSFSDATATKNNYLSDFTWTRLFLETIFAVLFYSSTFLVYGLIMFLSK